MAAYHLSQGAVKRARDGAFRRLERLLLNKPRVAIIGAGSSGIAAALELSRYKIECILLEQREHLGGI